MLETASKSIVAWPGKPPLPVDSRNPGVPFDLAWRDGLRVNQSVAPRVHARRAALREERRVNRVAAQGDHVYRPDDAKRR